MWQNKIFCNSIWKNTILLNLRMFAKFIYKVAKNKKDVYL